MVLTPLRVLFVVARDRPDVYASLCATFMESPRLGIVMDRRGPYMGTGTESESDRRRLAVDESLRTRGWARVRIDSAGRAALADDARPSRPDHGPHSDRR